jgi:hypothetical protein
VPQHISAAAPTPPPRSLEPLALSRLLPRSAVAIAITLAAATLAALVGSGAVRPRSSRSLSEGDGVEPGTPSVAAALRLPTVPSDSSEPASLPASSPSSPVVPGAECACPRHESLPWQAPLLRLSPVLISESHRTHDGHEHTELELALVNAGAREARQLNVSVVFYETGAAERSGHWQTGERPLSFEGPLAPGQAIRWHVEGRGASFDVIAPDLGTLAADGSDAAPADALARLATDAARPIRLHAIQLLAFLGDPRAESAGRALRSFASPAESDYLDRVLQPAPDLGACALNVVHEGNRWRVEACSFNRSGQAVNAPELRLLAFDAPLDRLRPGARAPSLLAEQALLGPAPLPAHGGRRVELSASLSLEAGRLPRAFELHIARAQEVP